MNNNNHIAKKVDISRFSVIIFDFDGVILDSELAQCKAWEKALTKFSLDTSRVDALHIIGIQDDEIVNYLVDDNNSQLRELIRKEKNTLMNLMFEAEQVKLVNGLEDAIKRLSKTHTLAIASNAKPARIDSVLSKNGLQKYFDIIVTAGDRLPSKPDPAIYLEALRKIGKANFECMVIEDSIPGLVAARKAKLYSIGITTGLPKNALEQYANEVIHSFAQII